MTLIKIDRTTIKKNPDYKIGGFYVYGPTEIHVKFSTFRYIKPYDDLGIGADIISFTENKPSVSSGTLILNSMDQFDKLPNYILVDSYENTTPRQFIHRMGGEPMYIYDYFPTNVTCEECKNSFLHTDLCSDFTEDLFNGCVCPFCGCWGCCEIKFEEFNENMLT